MWGATNPQEWEYQSHPVVKFNYFVKVVNEEDDLAESFNQLIEAGLKYISTVAKESEKHSLLPTAKFWRALLHKSYEILDKVCL